MVIQSSCVMYMHELFDFFCSIRSMVVNIYNNASLIDTEDYIAFQLVTLTFDVESVSGDDQCYDVAIIDDNVVENNEIFFVTLTSPEPVLIGSILSRATVIINPDPADGKLKLGHV